MEAIYLEPPFSPTVQRIMRATFPSYTGRKVKVRVASGPIDMRSYWDGGSRDYFVLCTSTGDTFQVPQQSAFDRPLAGAESFELTPAVVCVEHSIVCGKDMGLTIHVHGDAVAGYLPLKVDLGEEEVLVLEYTAARKSSYAGRNRFQQAQDDGRKVTAEAWDAAKAVCIERGFLNKAGAITPAGRNALAASPTRVHVY